MRWAVNIPPFADPPDLVELAIEAEQAGWDGTDPDGDWLADLRAAVRGGP